MAVSAQGLELGKGGKTYVLGQDSLWVSPSIEGGGGAPIGDPAVVGWTL